MASFVRRIERRIMRNAGLLRRDRPLFANDGKVLTVQRLVIDEDGKSYGRHWPRRIPAAFHAADKQLVCNGVRNYAI